MRRESKMRVVKEKRVQLLKLQGRVKGMMNLNEGNVFIRRYMLHFISDFITNEVSVV